MTIADTDVLIDFLAGRGEASTVETLLQRGTLRTTVISRYELLSGATTTKQLSCVLPLLEAVPSLPLDDAAVEAASEVRRSLDRAGQAISVAESLIAGIVISTGGLLLTRNRHHFERVPGVRLA